MIEMMETAKAKLSLNQSQFDWVLLATDADAYHKMLTDKEKVRQ